MSDNKDPSTDTAVTLFKTLMVDLPLAAAQRILGEGDDKSIMQAAWTGYDAWVKLTRNTVNGMYADPAFGAEVARLTAGTLRLQRLSNAMAQAFFAGLWPSIGLPTADEVRSLRTEVAMLREQLGESNRDEEDIVTDSDLRHRLHAQARQRARLMALRAA